MIKAILIFNNHGKPRLSKFYEHYSEDTEQQIIRETFHLVSKRDENVCNFLEGGMLIGGSENKLIYRHYATLYFVFCVDSSESELGILDLIQVFVETLDKCFENVCELDLIFHVDKVHNILAEMVMGGMVLETNMNEIITQVDAQNKMEKSEVRAAALVRDLPRSGHARLYVSAGSRMPLQRPCGAPDSWVFVLAGPPLLHCHAKQNDILRLPDPQRRAHPHQHSSLLRG
uniref:AP complex mu/sigma subunit domain-containing protein n=1 Tax=Esox lucius TaxID=8010 RepID=A0AAY5LDP9_ESOLU